jgi:hypothetical protein
VIQTSDGGYALAGTTYSFGAGNFDCWLVKTDTNGNALWNRTYGGTGYDEAQSVVQTRDGGYALAGTTHYFGTADFWLIKTEAESGLAWVPSSVNTITLVRDAATPWGFVRVQIWKKR